MSSDAATPRPRSGYPDLAHMWRALLDGDWRSLAVVPTAADVSADLVVAALNESRENARGPLVVVDARDMDPTECRRVAREIGEAVKAGSRTITFVDSVMDHLGPLHVLEATEAVLLVIRLGGVHLGSVEATVSTIGPQRILGSVATPADD